MKTAGNHSSVAWFAGRVFYGDGHRGRMATDAMAMGRIVHEDSMWAWAFKAIAALNDRPWATYRKGVREGWNALQGMTGADCNAGTFGAALWMGKALVRLACRYEVIPCEDVPLGVREECGVQPDDIVPADAGEEEGDNANPPTPRNKDGKRSLVDTEGEPVKKRKKGPKPATAAAADGDGQGHGAAATESAGAGQGRNGAEQPAPPAAATSGGNGATHALGGAATAKNRVASGGQGTASALRTPGLYARGGNGGRQGTLLRQISGSPWSKVPDTGGGNGTPQGGGTSQWSREAPDGTLHLQLTMLCNAQFLFHTYG